MKKIIFKLLLVVLLLQGCSKWLAVTPTDRITKDVTFSTINGFRTALNGVYIELNSPALYGKNLSYDFVDLLANRYAISSESQDKYQLVTEQYYTSAFVKGTLTSTWEKAYNMIANLNLIIENTESNRSVLNDTDYAIIRGEALALRALLHFDMLRLFGPVPTDKITLSIPYYTTFDFLKKEYLNVDAAIALIVEDLLASGALLKEYDPIVKNGINDENKDNFLNYRNIRFNYYAVKGMLARVYLYGGDKPLALEVAKEVIAVQESYFPFTAPEKTVNSLDDPDRLFMSEILFGLQNSSRSSIFSSTFNAMSLDAVNAYYSLSSVVESSDCFESSRLDDSRFKCWFNEMKEISGQKYYIFGKYKGGVDNKILLNQIMPIMRISEVYYIAAESEPNRKDGLVHLNKVRNNRKLQNESSTSAGNFENYIRKEYTRETWGEGQLFFYYKRLNKTSFPSAYKGSISMTAMKYIMPLPDDEKNYK